MRPAPSPTSPPAAKNSGAWMNIANSPPKRSSTGHKEKRTRQSKLAKENGITGDEEAEIKEAFHLFSTKSDDYPSEKEGVIKTQDVRHAMIALGISPTDQKELASILSAVDPTATGFVPYEPFLSVCALKLHSRDEDAIFAEVEHAYKLFTRGTAGPISVAHLRRVARDLKEDVSEELLRDMVREANGGDGLHAGVSLEQFREVMVRAGVF
ncbi:conserved hypothetical protein [Histoplasma mississippiense (nom. inval.)]|uniref:conserved hypothetical protein n=1 Tax=Ajellomyces capsulatus (strain NAm1 / WU24) TaxID=2059318 RepID=UPI000157BAA6|nr:conserved hypothetical protein [Histoplasma mississippiense (nom. inval.)]EDN05889.1 conserved hypothetical protein [Histoplasma mississippiense (nom. inval.)]